MSEKGENRDIVEICTIEDSAGQPGSLHSPSKFSNIRLTCLCVVLVIQISSHSHLVACHIICLFSLGVEGVLPGRYIESFLRVFKQFTHT